MSTVKRLTQSDRSDLERLLVEAGLGPDGLGTPGEVALGIRSGGKLVGCAVIERYGTDALLRSVAVSLDCRGTGLGRGLVEAAEHEAKHLPARRLYLLTETADSFFVSLGYRPIDRDLVPGEVRGSAQFSVLCPVSAVVMVREIGLNLFADSPSSAE